jgi:hypothetical protein
VLLPFVFLGKTTKDSEPRRGTLPSIPATFLVTLLLPNPMPQHRLTLTANCVQYASPFSQRSSAGRAAHS